MFNKLLKKYIIYMDGGICSQISQYMLGCELENQGYVVEYDLSWYQKKGLDLLGNHNRRFDLLRLSPSLSLKQASSMSCFIWKRFFYAHADFEAISAPPRYLGGYAEWSKRISEKVSAKIPLSAVLDDKNKEMLEQIDNTQNSVGVHVRRGDMTLAGYYWKILTPRYYTLSMNFFSQAVFYIFSDDVEWARRNIVETNPEMQCVVVDINDNASGYLDLILLSHCRSFICSSGSLGKYASYYGDPDEGAAVVPVLREEDEVIVGKKRVEKLLLTEELCENIGLENEVI